MLDLPASHVESMSVTFSKREFAISMFNSHRVLITVLLTVALAALAACQAEAPSTSDLSQEAVTQAGPGDSASSIAREASPTSAPSGAGQSRTVPPTPKAAAGLVPAFGHIYTIVMENKEYGNVVGDNQAPYLSALIARYGLATDYHAVSHPSEPNYLALFSGSTQGVTNDSVQDLKAPNLADQLEAKGKTWKIFAENVPQNCFTGSSASGGEDGAGTYARKHDPAISFTNISTSPVRCANIVDLTRFDPAAANYELIAPNDCHDMHSCSVADGDAFLKGFVPKILNSAAWQDGGVLFIVWDEGTSNQGGGGHVPLIVVSSRVPQGFRSSTPHNHYSLLRTVEDAWGLGCLGEACGANNLAEFFP